MTRVAVTTTPDAAHRLSDPLREVGLEPVELPCIRTVPASDETRCFIRQAAPGADWIVVTSRRAVELMWPEGDMPPGPAVAAVGPATADAVVRAGGSVSVVGGGGAARLADLIESRVPGATVVFPHARAADPDTITRLQEAGADVVAAPAYDTEPIPPGDDQVDAVLFGSPSAVEGWMMSRSLDGLIIGAMGETTAAALEEAGHPAEVVPAHPGFHALVSALADHLASRERKSS